MSSNQLSPYLPPSSFGGGIGSLLTPRNLRSVYNAGRLARRLYNDFAGDSDSKENEQLARSVRQRTSGSSTRTPLRSPPSRSTVGAGTPGPRTGFTARSMATRKRKSRGKFSRKGKRSFKRRGVSRRGRGARVKLTRKSITDALANTNHLVRDYAEIKTAPASSSTAGIRCLYFAFNNDIPTTNGDPYVIVKMASNINPADTQPDIAIETCGMKLQHTITNDCNMQVEIEGWLLRARRDLPNTAKYNTGLLEDLGRGFAMSNIDPTNPSKTNGGLNLMEYTPFMARAFLLDYQIVRRKRVTLGVGKSTNAFSQINKKKSMNYPSQFTTMASGSTWSTAVVNLTDRRGEEYWLFRLHSKQVGINVISSNLVSDIGAKVTMVTRVDWAYKEVQQTKPFNSDYAYVGYTSGTTTNIFNSESGAATTETVV